MKTTTIFIATLLGATVVSAQNPLSTELKQQYAAIKDPITKSADRMADADYGFKPARPETPGHSPRSSGISPTFRWRSAAPPRASRSPLTPKTLPVLPIGS